MEKEKVKKENMSVAAQWKREDVKDEVMFWAYTEEVAIDSVENAMKRQGIENPEAYLYELYTVEEDYKEDANKSKWTLRGNFEGHSFVFDGAMDKENLEDWTLDYKGDGSNVGKLLKIMRKAILYAQKKAEEFRSKHWDETEDGKINAKMTVEVS